MVVHEALISYLNGIVISTRSSSICMVCGGNADADEAIMKIVKIDHILAAAGKLGGAGGSVGRTAKNQV